MRKKTIDVSELVDLVNRRLQYSPFSPGSPTERQAYASLLEDVLVSTGNYKGFVYLQGNPSGNDTEFDDSLRRYLK
jgi:hypothetical protein